MLRPCAGNFNFLYSDDHGNIAYWHIGRIPVRARGDDPFLPHPGNGSDEWTGFIPFDLLPHVVNPRQGWLANWTTKPIANWPNSTAGLQSWGPAERVQVLFRLLSAIRPGSATVATLASINRVAGQTAESPVGDEENVPIEVVLPLMLSHVQARPGSRLLHAVAILRRWNRQRVDTDGDGRYDNPAVAIYNRWYADFAAHAFAREFRHPADKLTAEDVVAPGQSGVPTSPHFADQLRLYATWKYKTMRLTRADLDGHIESALTLQLPDARHPDRRDTRHR